MLEMYNEGKRVAGRGDLENSGMAEAVATAFDKQPGGHEVRPYITATASAGSAGGLYGNG